VGEASISISLKPSTEFSKVRVLNIEHACDIRSGECCGALALSKIAEREELLVPRIESATIGVPQHSTNVLRRRPAAGTMLNPFS
jgi:hypothetical protein